MGTAKKERVAIIKTRKNKSWDKSLYGICGQKMTDGKNATEFKISLAYQILAGQLQNKRANFGTYVFDSTMHKRLRYNDNNLRNETVKIFFIWYGRFPVLAI